MEQESICLMQLSLQEGPLQQRVRLPALALTRLLVTLATLNPTNHLLHQGPPASDKPTLLNLAAEALEETLLCRTEIPRAVAPNFARGAGARLSNT